MQNQTATEKQIASFYSRIAAIQDRLCLYRENGWKQKEEDCAALKAFCSWREGQETADACEAALSIAEASKRARGQAKARQVARNIYR